jgi:hypothetical protein
MGDVWVLQGARQWGKASECGSGRDRHALAVHGVADPDHGMHRATDGLDMGAETSRSTVCV